MSIHISSFIPEDSEPEVFFSPGIHYTVDGERKLSPTLVHVQWAGCLAVGLDFDQALRLAAALIAALDEHGPDVTPLDLTDRSL